MMMLSVDMQLEECNFSLSFFFNFIYFLCNVVTKGEYEYLSRIFCAS